MWELDEVLEATDVESGSTEKDKKRKIVVIYSESYVSFFSYS